MPIDRIEMAVECDDVEDALPAVAIVVEALGLDIDKDVTVDVASSDEGKPVLLAVMVKESADDDD